VIRRKANFEFSMSFLDTIACGFGAIILLLIVTRITPPAERGALEQAALDTDGLVAALQQQLFTIRGEARVLDRDMVAAREQLADEQARIARLQAELRAMAARFAASRSEASDDTVVEARMALARQTLTDEMERLQRAGSRRENALIGGIPVDSEYIIFVIDTSGSMFNGAWPLMLAKIEETLDIYPEVKGIQVMNDEGGYMFSEFSDRWIPDSPGRRRAIIERLRSWTPFSNSSPVEGVQKAISAFWAPDRRISIYVIGDEFTGPSITDVIDTIDRINRADEKGTRRVRIHAVGFPTLFDQPGPYQATAIRFATLMREVCHRNGGTFVGLPSRE
jgi:hypothetical protein